jgi:hypothetical protein
MSSSADTASRSVEYELCEIRVPDCPDGIVCNDVDTWDHTLMMLAEKNGFDRMPAMRNVFARIDARIVADTSD